MLCSPACCVQTMQRVVAIVCFHSACCVVGDVRATPSCQTCRAVLCRDQHANCRATARCLRCILVVMNCDAPLCASPATLMSGVAPKGSSTHKPASTASCMPCTSGAPHANLGQLVPTIHGWREASMFIFCRMEWPTLRSYQVLEGGRISAEHRRVATPEAPVGLPPKAVLRPQHLRAHYDVVTLYIVLHEHNSPPCPACYLPWPLHW
jgi:hypothetical protein